MRYYIDTRIIFVDHPDWTEECDVEESLSSIPLSWEYEIRHARWCGFYLIPLVDIDIFTEAELISDSLGVVTEIGDIQDVDI